MFREACLKQLSKGSSFGEASMGSSPREALLRKSFEYLSKEAYKRKLALGTLQREAHSEKLFNEAI